MKRTLLALAMLLLVPAGQSCSLLYQEFSQADLDGQKVLANRGQSLVLIDLATGKEATLANDFFPDFQFAGTSPYVLHNGQEGLGADCTGRTYFEVLRTSGTEVHSQAGVVAFASGGTTVAWLTEGGLYTMQLGSWSSKTRIAAGATEETYPTLAVSDDGKRLALSMPDGAIRVLDLQGNTIHAYSDLGDAAWSSALAWHGNSLVVARAADGTATFVIIDTTTGATRTFSFASDDWNHPTIAPGASLLLAHGDTVLRVTEAGSQKLKVVGNREVGAVAGDGKGAVILFQADDDGWSKGEGILQVGAGGAFGKWHVKGTDWAAAARPAFSWQTGPAPTVSQAQAPTLEEAPGAPAGLLLGAIAALALVRRRN